MVDDDHERTERALAQAASEWNLPDYYRDCVKPLLRIERAGWPMCCGGGCEPCNQVLVAVADRTLELLEKSGPNELPRRQNG